MNYTGIQHGNLNQVCNAIARKCAATGQSTRSAVVAHPWFKDASNHETIAQITNGRDQIDAYLMETGREMSQANAAKMGARIGMIAWVNRAKKMIEG
jgi:hypothetical protein